MPTYLGQASIVMNQATVAAPGVAGLSRDDGVLGQLVTLRNADGTNVTKYTWGLLRPRGSAAVLSSPKAPTCQFTPDVEGSYGVLLLVNEGVGKLQAQSRVFAVRTAGGLRYPHQGETNEANWTSQYTGNPNETGWWEDLIDLFKAAGGGVNGTIITVEPEAGLPASRQLIAGNGIEFDDLGPGSTLEINSSSGVIVYRDVPGQAENLVSARGTKPASRSTTDYGQVNLGSEADASFGTSGDYSTISGGEDNIASADYATIGGGNRNEAVEVYSGVFCGLSNNANGQYSVILGGVTNEISADKSTLCGGELNVITEAGSFIGGGKANESDVQYGVVVGGFTNVLSSGNYGLIVGGSSNSLAGLCSAIVGGLSNAITGTNAFLGGGFENVISADYAVVAGGFQCSADAVYACVLGGYMVTATAPWSAAVGGGTNNAQGSYSLVAGGTLNNTSGQSSAVVGGAQNLAGGAESACVAGLENYSGGESSVVAGGTLNQAIGRKSFVGGGENNIASATSACIVGSDNAAQGEYSLALGRSNSASADYTIAIGRSAEPQHPGAHVYKDGAATTVQSTADNQLTMSYAGGVRMLFPSAVLRRSGYSSNNNYTDEVHGAASSTNATPATSQVIRIPNGQDCHIRGVLKGKQSGSNAARSLVYEATYTNNGGTVALVGAAVTNSAQTTGAGSTWATAVNINTDTLEVAFTGAVGTTIRWTWNFTCSIGGAT